MIRLCISGVTGRMGRALAREAVLREFEIVGAVASLNNANIGRSLRDAGICDLDTPVMDPPHLNDCVKYADVYVSFAAPAAELTNLPAVADMGKRIVMGTTGFTNEERATLEKSVETRVPAVFSPNFAPGINILFKLVRTLGLLPSDYDFSIAEIHHTGKRDAPSGTAKKIGELVSKVRGYSSLIHGRNGESPRNPTELEILSARVGGVPGLHDLIVSGPHEMIRIEHIAFSRSVFAQGALHAAEWIMKRTKAGIYTMNDVLNEKRQEISNPEAPYEI